MLELDLLLLPFFEEEYEALISHQQQAFEELLEQDDPDLLQWFSQKGKPQDPALAGMVKMILDRVAP